MELITRVILSALEHGKTGREGGGVRGGSETKSERERERVRQRQRD